MGALVAVEAAKLGQGVGAMAVASRAGEGKKVAPPPRGEGAIVRKVVAVVFFSTTKWCAC